ncbi:Lateral signaling target protein 2 homolog [Eumeta japonica]|uniref:Lateral signaling target protein 2 homolog n=1 Tax=Eumeta variegata TaxID=151549 RepID=A0A4C1SBP7_EUMVA|nr:Lateral signaling target protein 2 homolog [Eumeta japonica]
MDELSLIDVRGWYPDYDRDSERLNLDKNDAATEQLYESLKRFDRLFAEFEWRYVSAMDTFNSKDLAANNNTENSKYSANYAPEDTEKSNSLKKTTTTSKLQQKQHLEQNLHEELIATCSIYNQQFVII